MKVWELAGFGLEHLRLAEVDVPQLGNNEVLVQVSAVSLNARDKLLVDGVYNPDLRFPMVQGSDAVGRYLRLVRTLRGSSLETGFSRTSRRAGLRVLPSWKSRVTAWAA